MLNQNDTSGHLASANNENLLIPDNLGKNKCQSVRASTSGATSHCEISRHNDLSMSACQLEGSHRMATFEFDHKTANASQLCETTKVPTSKPIYQRENCAISSFYSYADGNDPRHFHTSSNGQCSQLPDSISLFNQNAAIGPSNHSQTADTFDLTYSLVNDGQNLLDDFSALIDDLREDSFSLVDGLID